MLFTPRIVSLFFFCSLYCGVVEASTCSGSAGPRCAAAKGLSAEDASVTDQIAIQLLQKKSSMKGVEEEASESASKEADEANESEGDGDANMLEKADTVEASESASTDQVPESLSFLQEASYSQHEGVSNLAEPEDGSAPAILEPDGPSYPALEPEVSFVEEDANPGKVGDAKPIAKQAQVEVAKQPMAREASKGETKQAPKQIAVVDASQARREAKGAIKQVPKEIPAVDASKARREAKPETKQAAKQVPVPASKAKPEAKDDAKKAAKQVLEHLPEAKPAAKAETKQAETKQAPKEALGNALKAKPKEIADTKQRSKNTPVVVVKGKDAKQASKHTSEDGLKAKDTKQASKEVIGDALKATTKVKADINQASLAVPPVAPKAKPEAKADTKQRAKQVPADSQKAQAPAGLQQVTAQKAQAALEAIRNRKTDKRVKSEGTRYATCWDAGFDMESRDAFCEGSLKCARRGFDGRSFGDCKEHCCSKEPMFGTSYTSVLFVILSICVLFRYEPWLNDTFKKEEAPLAFHSKHVEDS